MGCEIQKKYANFFPQFIRPPGNMVPKTQFCTQMCMLTRIQSRIKGMRSQQEAVKYRNKVCDVYKRSKKKWEFFTIHHHIHPSLEHVNFTKKIQLCRIKRENIFDQNFQCAVGCKIQEKVSTIFPHIFRPQTRQWQNPFLYPNNVHSAEILDSFPARHTFYLGSPLPPTLTSSILSK
jgi:hypothetical protein